MRLSARMCADVSSVNTFSTVTSLELTQGDGGDIYFQLIDLSVDKAHNPPGRRYCPAALSTLSVTIQNIDDTITITKSATQPFSGDLSFWKVSFDPLTDATALAGLVGTLGLKLTLTEPTADPLRPKVTYAFVPSALTIYRSSPEF